MPVDLADLNDLDRAAFVAALGEVFEHAPWVAEAAYAGRPFTGVTALHEAMLSVLLAGPPEEVTRFLSRHPDLAGPRSDAQALTDHSTAEQASAGFDRLTEAEAARLAEWNARYWARFKFPFIICVRRHSKESVFAEFERRLGCDPAVELHAALDEIARITALRLVATVSGPGMPNVYGKLSTHLLDINRGSPAAGVPVQLVTLSADGSARLVSEAVSNGQGHTDAPLIGGRPIPIGCYELHFSLGRYFAHHAPSQGRPSSK